MKTLRKLQGFTLPEVIVAVLLTSLIIVSTVSIIINFGGHQKVSDEYIDVLKKTEMLLESILSGKTLLQYGLSASEQLILRQKFPQREATFLDLDAQTLRWQSKQKLKTYDRKMKIDDSTYQVIVEREIIQATPFLLGFSISLKNSSGITAQLHGVVSYYDLSE